MANMQRGSNLLLDKTIRSAKPKDKDYTLRDGGGLQLLIKPNGSKLWEIRFTIKGKAKKTTLGNYPTVKLKDARDKRDEYLSLVSEGVDPINFHREKKELEKKQSSNQFHLIVREWIYDRLTCSQTHKDRKYRNFERDLFPHFCTYDKDHNITSSLNISDITHYKLLEVLQQKEKTAIESANRLLADCRALWVYAYERGYTEELATLKISKNALKKVEKSSYSKITDIETLQELFQKIDNYHGEPITRALLKFVSIVPLRADNLCNLQWEQIDFDKKVLRIPRSEMKLKDKNLPDFVLPLSHQAIKILEDIKKLTGWGRWVFHGKKDINAPINKETGNKALRIMGYGDKANNKKQTLHSFRGTYRSLVDTYQNQHNATFEAKERVLDHHEKSGVVRAYTHRADYTEQMRELLQWYADFLDEVKNGTR